MPEVTDPALLEQLNAGRRAPQPILTVPNTSKERDDVRADAGAQNDQVRTGIAVREEDRTIDDRAFKKERDLAAEYSRNPEVAGYRATMPTIASALRAPKNGQGDLSIIYAYAKVMDPGSVVRESEMEMASSTSPWAQAKVQELRNQLDGSGRLPPATRAGLEQEMIRKGQALRKSYDGERSRYMTDAQAYGLDPNRVVGAHHGEAFRDTMQSYDKERGLGRFAPGAQANEGGGAVLPTMRGGVVEGTDVQFGMDAWGEPDKPFNHADVVRQKYGIEPDQEDWIVAFWRSNAGNQALTPDAVRAAYAQAGLPPHTYGPEAEGHIAQMIDNAKKGFSHSPIDTSAEEQAYRAQLDQLNQGRMDNAGAAARDPNSMAGFAQRVQTGVPLGLADEAAGVGGFIGNLVTGENPTDGYVMARDADRLLQEQMREQQGAAGYVAEFAGSIPSALAIPTGPGRVMGNLGGSGMVGQGFRGGVRGGAVAGFGQGEGLADSVVGAGGGAVVGGTVGGAFGGAGNLLTRRGVAPATPGAAQRYANAQEFDLPVSPADVGGRGSRIIERNLETQPASAAFIEDARLGLGQSLERATGDVADTFGRSTTQRGMGEVLQKGARGWADDFFAKSAKNYEAIPIGPEVEAVTTSTVGKLQDLTGRITSNPELAGMVQDKRLAGYLKALDGGKLSWTDMKSFRTRIGEELGEQMFGEKTLKTDLKALYGALSDDMEMTAIREGTAAHNAFRKANSFHAQGSRRIDDAVSTLLGKDGDKSPEAAAGLIQRIVKGDKASSDLKLLAQVRKTLKPDEWGKVSNALIRVAGRPAGSTGRDFDPGVFMRTFADMSPGAKNILFGKGELRTNLDNFLGVVDGIAKNAATRNTSNTALATGANLTSQGVFAGLGATLGGIPGALIGVGLNHGMQAGAAKLWTNPAFVRWFTGYSKMLSAAARSGNVNPQAQSGQMAALSRLAASRPEIGMEVRAMQQRLNDVYQQGVSAGPERLAAQPGDGQQGEARPTTIEVPR